MLERSRYEVFRRYGAEVGVGGRRGLLLSAVVAAALVAGLATWLVLHPSASDRAATRLKALGPPIPGLPVLAAPVLTDPSCEVFRSCASAAFTWSLSGDATKFRYVVREIDAWAAARDLRGVVWICGPQQARFGARAHGGCVAAFDVTKAGESVFAAVTFDQPGYPAQLDSWTNGQNMPLELAGEVVRSIATQVVIGVDRFE